MSRSITAVFAVGVAAAASLAAPAEAHAAEQADVVTCVLQPGGGADCAPGRVDASEYVAVAMFHQHPNYEGKMKAFALPRHEAKCTPGYDDEYSVNIRHGGFWDNRISSVDTRFSAAARRAACDVKLWDDHHLGPQGKDPTVWIDKYHRLSRLGDGFDNRTSSFEVS